MARAFIYSLIDFWLIISYIQFFLLLLVYFPFNLVGTQTNKQTYFDNIFQCSIFRFLWFMSSSVFCFFIYAHKSCSVKYAFHTVPHDFFTVFSLLILILHAINTQPVYWSLLFLPLNVFLLTTMRPWTIRRLPFNQIRNGNQSIHTSYSVDSKHANDKTPLCTALWIHSYSFSVCLESNRGWVLCLIWVNTFITLIILFTISFLFIESRIKS